MDQSALLRRGAALHQAGQLAQAQALYRQVLAQDPGNAEALHLLGVLAHQTGHHAAAEQLIRQATSLAPQAAKFHSSHGHVLRALNRAAEAEASYRTALRAQPNTPDFHHHLALAQRDQGRVEEAEHSFRQAIRLRRDFVAARLDLGNLLLETGRAKDAEACLRAALRAAPGHPQVLNGLGLSLIGQGQKPEALAAFDQALASAPQYANAAFNRANCLASLDRLDEAAAAFATLVEGAPEDADVVLSYVRLLLQQDRAAEAIASLQRLTTIQPDHVPALHELARAHARQDRADLALPLLERVTRLQPEQADAWFELGMAYRDVGRWPESVAPHAEAVRLRPDDADFRSCYAYALLANGDFARGWPEFRWRTRKPGNVRLREPEWDGSPTQQTVIIHAEQGIGDTIQFCRFIPQVARLARVVIACPPSLTTLLRGLPDVAEVADGLPVPAYDLHCPLMSLPEILGVAPESFGEPVPYLHAAPARIEMWHQRLAHLPGRRVGLVWAGNPKYPVDRKRSVPFAALAPLQAVDGISLVSLQMADARGDAAGARMFDAAPLLADYADTAALIMALDLVISVDTSVAHLAGALGREIWLLNRADTDWRWLLGRSDSPWYPSMTIFRQPAPGDWSPVVEAVKERLTGIWGRRATHLCA